MFFGILCNLSLYLFTQHHLVKHRVMSFPEDFKNISTIISDK